MILNKINLFKLEKKKQSYKDTRVYKITWKAGNSSVEKVGIDDLKDKTVKVTLDKEGKAKKYLSYFCK